jgi:hypothetical protein
MLIWRIIIFKYYGIGLIEQVIAGNTNTYVAEKRELDPVLIARKLRFFPYSHHRRTVCMRVEIYGCPWFVIFPCRLARYAFAFVILFYFIFYQVLSVSFNCAI